MKKLIALFLFFTCVGFAQHDTIWWNAHTKLSYADFKAPAPDTGIQNAYANVGITYSYYIKDSCIYITTRSYFVSSKSWFKKQAHLQDVDSTLLKHQQGYLDEGEVSLRSMRFKLPRTWNDTVSFNLQVNQLLKTTRAQLADSYAWFNLQTDNGTNKKKQDNFLPKIQADMWCLPGNIERNITIKIMHVLKVPKSKQGQGQFPGTKGRGR